MKKISSLAAFFLVIGSSVAAPVISPVPNLVQEPQHATASKRVTNYFTREHYLGLRIDDELSSKVFDRYLKSLDFFRNVLLKSDVDGFEKYRHEFDNGLAKGQFDFAYQMFNLSLTRRLERFDYAISLLDKPFDFTQKDSYEFEREDAPWAADVAQLNELWRQKVKFDALNLKLAGKTAEETTKLLKKRYENAKKRLLQTESEDVFQIVMNSYARSIEAHTSYLSPRNAERFQQEMNLSLEGIGAVLQSDDDFTVIMSLVPGGPADMTKKIKPKDKIIGVAQGEEEFVDVVGWRLDDVVDLIKGPKGSTVRLQVLVGGDASKGVPTQISIVRDKIRLEDRAAKAEVLEPKLSPLGKKIGVINIPSFYNNLTEDVKKEIASLKQQNVDGIIVDLRGNGGGSLPEAVSLTGLFIDKGPVVQIREAGNRIGISQDQDGSVFYNGPLTVMVDRYSASASEIFAAALQDYGRALIVGEHTFGKGTVQQHRTLGRVYDMFEESLGSVQFTIAKFYRIDGGSTQHKGVTPDILFPSPIEPGEWGESKEENALPWDSIPPAQYESSDEIKKALPVLQKKHQERFSKETEYKYLMDDIALYTKEKDEKTISLNEQERLKKKDENTARDLQRVNERLARLKLPAVKNLDDLPEVLEKLDPLLEETAQITVDMLSLGHLAKRAN
ncbi:carboxy terminal-processing peptidase [Rheinheimera soli]|uniref:carboxy terminal-processing peptidase n=1 Tax=Rheinheimera soli TaxID=443616 RepID=UPI001E52E9FD|nr:carboxy terminal-processing peptidase [Rheinheimera soli]